MPVSQTNLLRLCIAKPIMLLNIRLGRPLTKISFNLKPTILSTKTYVDGFELTTLCTLKLHLPRYTTMATIMMYYIIVQYDSEGGRQGGIVTV